MKPAVDIIQVSQDRPVTIVRLLCLNSHDDWRESRQTDKALVEIAMRALDQDTNRFLLQLLNEANRDIKVVHESGRALELLAGRKTVPLSETIPSLLGDEESEDNMTGGLQTGAQYSRQSRKRKAPERYEDQFGTIKGKNFDDADEDEDDTSGEDSKDFEWNPKMSLLYLTYQSLRVPAVTMTSILKAKNNLSFGQKRLNTFAKRCLTCLAPVKMVYRRLISTSIEC